MSSSLLLLEAHPQDLGLPPLQVENALAEESVGPGEPASCPPRGIVASNTLVDESKLIGAADELSQLLHNFVRVVGGEDPNDGGH